MKISKNDSPIFVELQYGVTYGRGDSSADTSLFVVKSPVMFSARIGNKTVQN